MIICPKNEQLAEKQSFEGKCEIWRTIFQPRASSSHKPTSRKVVYLIFYNPLIYFWNVQFHCWKINNSWQWSKVWLPANKSKLILAFPRFYYSVIRFGQRKTKKGDFLSIWQLSSDFVPREVFHPMRVRENLIGPTFLWINFYGFIFHKHLPIYMEIMNANLHKVLW